MAKPKTHGHRTPHPALLGPKLVRRSNDERIRYAWALGLRGPRADGHYYWRYKVERLNPQFAAPSLDEQVHRETCQYQLDMGTDLGLAIEAASSMRDAAQRSTSIAVLFDSVRQLALRECQEAVRVLDLHDLAMVRYPSFEALVGLVTGLYDRSFGDAAITLKYELNRLATFQERMTPEERERPLDMWSSMQIREYLRRLSDEHGYMGSTIRQFVYVARRYCRKCNLDVPVEWAKDTLFDGMHFRTVSSHVTSEPVMTIQEAHVVLAHWREREPYLYRWLKLFALTGLRSGSMVALHADHIRGGPGNHLWIVQDRKTPVGARLWRPKRDVCVPVADELHSFLMEWLDDHKSRGLESAWLLDWTRENIKSKKRSLQGRPRSSMSVHPQARHIQSWWHAIIQEALGRGCRRKMGSWRKLIATYMPAESEIRQAIGGWLSADVMNEHYRMHLPHRDMVTAVEAWNRILNAPDVGLHASPFDTTR